MASQLQKIAACTGLLFTGSVLAEPPSVTTVYGRISTALESVNLAGGGAKTSMKSYSSRVGVTGNERIDNDTSIIYGIEAQLLSDSGVNGLGGDLRNVYVGVKNEQLGTLMAGRLDPLISAPLYRQLFTALDLVGYDTGSFQIIAVSGRDTGTGNLVGMSGTPPVPTGLIAGGTQTLLARARVSNAFGYNQSTHGVDVETRIVLDGPNDVTGVPSSIPGETSAIAYEVAASMKRETWFAGIGYEKDTSSTATSSLTSRFGQRIQLAGSGYVGIAKFGATYARNSVDTNVAGAKKDGGEYAFSGTLPLMNKKAALIANYAARDLFGTDNTATTATGVAKPLATPGAKRRQFAVGLHYDLSKRTQTYLMYNLTEGSTKASNDEAKVYSVGMKHMF